MDVTRKCRFCGTGNALDAPKCAHCGKARWNDPDDTRLGRELGELERSDPAVGAAAAKYERDMAKLLADVRERDDGS